jgi:hypothetical protein
MEMKPSLSKHKNVNNKVEEFFFEEYFLLQTGHYSPQSQNLDV